LIIETSFLMERYFLLQIICVRQAFACPSFTIKSSNMPVLFSDLRGATGPHSRQIIEEAISKVNDLALQVTIYYFRRISRAGRNRMGEKV